MSHELHEANSKHAHVENHAEGEGSKWGVKAIQWDHNLASPEHAKGSHKIFDHNHANNAKAAHHLPHLELLNGEKTHMKR